MEKLLSNKPGMPQHLPGNYLTVLSGRTGLSRYNVWRMVHKKQTDHLAWPHVEALTVEYAQRPSA